MNSYEDEKTARTSVLTRLQYRPKATFVVTASVSTGFFRGQLAYYVAHGFDVAMVSAPGSRLDEMRGEGAATHGVPMEREISIRKDLVSLWRLWRLFRRTRPDLVVAGTPKAGLLATVAARFAGIPQVVLTLQGLRMETARGWKRAVLWSTEWISCHAAHRVNSVSPSLRERVIGLRLVEPERSSVVGNGTSNGIDTAHWRRTPVAVAAGRRTREALGIAETAPVIGFVGRLVRDKGIAELYEAFTRLRRTYPDLHLLLVGDFESGDPVSPELRAQLEADTAATITGFVADPAPYYWAMDAFALPTYREGFPGAPLEAQAASVPVVCSDATGAVDALVDGVTGLRVPVGDAAALGAALDRLLSDAALRALMGQAGVQWVEEDFEREKFWGKLLAEYQQLLQRRPRSPQNGFRRLIKVGLDRLAAAVLLLLTLPVWLVVAIAIRVSMGSPMLFRQVRPGLNGRPFTLLKFRTMRDAMNASGHPLPDGERLTPLGRFLRATSLDELPQLWNVLRGDMSLVGPRPLLPEYLSRYNAYQRRRHEVLPGITGWAQVNGRNAIDWEEKFALDVWYVDQWSHRLDARILWQTLCSVIRREGISNGRHATMPEFRGAREAVETMSKRSWCGGPEAR